jgi:hypothetical protein
MEWSDWDAEARGMDCEPGVRLTLRADIHEWWLCWDEVVALHRWLGAKIAAAQKAGVADG